MPPKYCRILVGCIQIMKDDQKSQRWEKDHSVQYTRSPKVVAIGDVKLDLLSIKGESIRVAKR